MNISLSALFAPENLVSRDEFGSPVPRQPAHLHTRAESSAYLRDASRVPRRRPFIYLIPPYAIGPVRSLSGHCSPRHDRRSRPVSCHGCCCKQPNYSQKRRDLGVCKYYRSYSIGEPVQYQVCMYGHTFSRSYKDQPGKTVANPARRGQLNRDNEYFPVRVRT